MKVLAIESSCDETSAAVLEKTSSEISVLSNITATSLEMHAATGGIIPENAARMQVKYILPVIIEALAKSQNSSEEDIDTRKILNDDIDAIAVTYGPGLIGSLLVGVETAKTLSYVFQKPIIPVNHLLGHIYANFIGNTPNFPFIGLIVSGGHTDLLLFSGHNNYQWLGGTRDDAAGEAFDKIGRVLGLSYPAGPEIEKRALLAKEKTLKFKSPIMHEDNFDFSFSGLKTEARRCIEKESEQGVNDDQMNEICYATQKAIIDVLIKKTLKAAEKYNCTTILVGGGVSANQTLINQLRESAKLLALNPQVFVPTKTYCTDNAAMIGAYALMNNDAKTWENVTANPELYFT